ncbi:L-aminoadipate-semialdehyde dehydrogenase-phosphopantetheinyl transferase isoform X1 [Chiloscyllium plagiosum]|uniref:L-aminoadipate-semialdehyde dehydrogenase-phosphopantetheinyl transferase isoform X1 n=1 Tax=Chiloscyllium plagiosum TaxID=36176 RepID=UPI001CB842BB|nr:L-aminoadipate-semialdehyde dehydrogenase-phosphopantetheinyl transferase isoform X1 [Chiloscyllium plagiosum]
MRPWKAALSNRRMEGLRWAFGCGSWQPTRSEWLLAARCVQAEERERIGAFVFARDAKAAMGGRLLIRKLIAEKLMIPWNEIQLARTTKGKPYLANPVLTTIPNFNFNISHHGDYAVLAAEPNLQVGVDIVKTDFPGSSSVAEFFRIMNRQFTDYEWKTIKMAGDEWAQLDMFYRHWALKESFIKAIGIGVGFNLQRIEFHASPLHMQTGQVSKETMMFLDGDQEEAWTFEETILDDNHHVAVALGKPDMFGKYAVQVQEDINQEPPQFTLLSFKDLISSAIVMAPEDPGHWENFQAKHKKASRQHRMPV